MRPVEQDLLKITDYRVLGKLPDIFTFDDGTPLTSPEDWERRRAEMYKTAVELQYGTLPPDPEFLEVELLFVGANVRSYRIHTGTKAHPVSFLMKMVLPSGSGNYPVIVDGDMCFPYHMDKEFLRVATDQGVAWVFFDRTELAHDIQNEGRGKANSTMLIPTTRLVPLVHGHGDIHGVWMPWKSYVRTRKIPWLICR